MASMPMQQQAAAAPHPEGERRAVERAALSEDQYLQRHWMEGLLFPVQGGNERFARGDF